MGRNYWCEFCQRGFSDILSIRKKHLQSAQHQRNRKLHYDSFKDAATILQEESQKNPCKRFFQTGNCDFGEHCRFSHTNLDKLKTEIQSKDISGPIDLDKVNDWIERWKRNRKLLSKEEHKFHLPSGFPPVSQLPPSLQPSMEKLTSTSSDWGQ